MRLNQAVELQGRLVALVPYTARHVLRYHQWMKSEELQKLTASEPLTLEQEYQMQRNWQDDADKCTFIVLDKLKWVGGLCTEEDCMVGDVNLFLTDPEDPTIAEIEIMIAEPSYRGKGFGKETTMVMMYYGVTKLGIKKFQAKINLENTISIAMFQSFHFEEGNRRDDLKTGNLKQIWHQNLTRSLNSSGPEYLWPLNIRKKCLFVLAAVKAFQMAESLEKH
ncbi:alpha/beta-tubulin-N-acetyltransferase 9 isoform X1 [Chiloscyllium punctatum]|uniref:alpha/beta-tubulin-N-acetyltransferase 9 isoform X1 n=1 Tax=Chiloscyllium punctatum TaxID=137246 RepID=UPI003B63C7B4